MSRHSRIFPTLFMFIFVEQGRIRCIRKEFPIFFLAPHTQVFPTISFIMKNTYIFLRIHSKHARIFPTHIRKFFLIFFLAPHPTHQTSKEIFPTLFIFVAQGKISHRQRIYVLFIAPHTQAFFARRNSCISSYSWHAHHRQGKINIIFLRVSCVSQISARTELKYFFHSTTYFPQAFFANLFSFVVFVALHMAKFPQGRPPPPPPPPTPPPRPRAKQSDAVINQTSCKSSGIIAIHRGYYWGGCARRRHLWALREPPCPVQVGGTEEGEGRIEAT